jgi:DNA polymerase III alpha subunit
MRLDKYSNPIFSEQDLFEVLYKGQSLPFNIFADRSKDIASLEEQLDSKFWFPIDEFDIPLEEYDTAMQKAWFMPEEYQKLDIKKWILDQCTTIEELARVEEELEEFASRNMMNLLRWLKYFVDTCTKEDVVWGVGRGSSVASYVLYKIGVHSVNSMKYNLDWREFLR